MLSENIERPEGRTPRAPSSLVAGCAGLYAPSPGGWTWRSVRECHAVTPLSSGPCQLGKTQDQPFLSTSPCTHGRG
jgi:hypothetical protein